MGKHHSRHIDHEACIAYYRDALSARHALRVRAYLEANPDQARRARVDADLERAMAHSLEGALQEPVPPRLRIETRSAGRLWSGRVALMATIVISAAVGWWFGGLPVTTDSNTTFTDRVVSAVQQPVSPATTRTVARAPTASPAPDLSLQGYRLVRQRHLDGANPALIEFVYRSANGRRLRIYAEVDPEQQAVPTVTSRDGMSLAQWSEDGTRYALVGNMPEITLRALAQAARTAPTRGGGKLAGVEQWQTAQPDDEVRAMRLRQSQSGADDIPTPVIANDNFTARTDRM